MARTIKVREYTHKRGEILAVAQRLVYTKGYERMTIQDIQVELKISSGAFYHYFDSKPSLLEALIERMQQEAEQSLLPIIQNPHLTAPEKLQSFFTTIDRMRIAHKATVLQMLHVWYTDDNAIVRQKVDAATIERRVPLLNEIIHQGIQEGVFETAYPEQTSEIILALIQGMSNTHARLLLTVGQGCTEADCIKGIVATLAANMAAIERILGAQSYFLERINPEAVEQWLVMDDAKKKSDIHTG